MFGKFSVAMSLHIFELMHSPPLLSPSLYPSYLLFFSLGKQGSKETEAHFLIIHFHSDSALIFVTVTTIIKFVSSCGKNVKKNEQILNNHAAET